MFSATVALKSVGRCGTHAIRHLQAPGSHDARSTPPAVKWPASGSARSKSRTRVLLPPPLRARERHGLAGLELEVDAVDHEAPARRIRKRDMLEPDRRLARVGHRRCSRRPAGRFFHEVQEPLGHREAVGTGVELPQGCEGR